MTSAANFAQLLDGPVDLPPGSESLQREQYILDLPKSGEGALLSWNARCEQGTSVDYVVKVNDQIVASHGAHSKDWVALQKAMPTDSIWKGSNKVEFAVMGGNGTLSIGNVMLFYRKDLPVLTPQAADFAQLCDEPVGLRLDLRVEGGKRILTLPQEIPDGLASGEGALLSWDVQCAAGPPVCYEVVVNDTSLSCYTVTSRNWAAVQEAIHTDTLRKGSNTVEFRLMSGEGTLAISDVMLFYRVNALPGLTARVANFALLLDDAIALRRVGGVQSKLLEQKNIPAPKSGEGALLSWNVECVNHSVDYVVRVNGQVVVNDTGVLPRAWTAMQKAMHTDTIKEGDNKVEFEVTGGDGILLINDVILWYRRDPFTS